MGTVPRRAFLAACALVALAAPAGASAHATVVRASPADGAVLARAPAAVRIVFDDVVRVAPGVAAVRNGGGSILRGKARVSGGDVLLVPLRTGLGVGDYSVRWAIVSDDGHLQSGVIAFGVGAGRAPPRAALEPLATGPTAATVAGHWVFLVGVLGAVGLALFSLLVWRPAPREDETAERLALLVSVFAVLAAVGAADEVHRVGLATRDGTALGAGFVVALVVASLAAAATMERRVLVPALVAALCLAPVPAVAGHALDPGLPRLNVVVDVLHVAAASAWVGVLVGLLALRPPAEAMRRVIALAAGSVVLLIVTGVVRASFELVSLSQLWETSYGWTLIAKTDLVLLALLVGRLVRGNVTRRAAIELGVVAVLVVAVSVLVQLRPGRNAPVVNVPRAALARPLPPAAATRTSRSRAGTRASARRSSGFRRGSGRARG
jgi:copper transport protein